MWGGVGGIFRSAEEAPLNRGTYSRMSASARPNGFPMPPTVPAGSILMGAWFSSPLPDRGKKPCGELLKTESLGRVDVLHLGYRATEAHEVLVKWSSGVGQVVDPLPELV